MHVLGAAQGEIPQIRIISLTVRPLVGVQNVGGNKRFHTLFLLPCSLFSLFAFLLFLANQFFRNLDRQFVIVRDPPFFRNNNQTRADQSRNRASERRLGICHCIHHRSIRTSETIRFFIEVMPTNPRKHVELRGGHFPRYTFARLLIEK